MALCFEILKLSNNNVREVWHRINWEMGQYFFQKDGLRELGWCSQYSIDRRSVNYKKEEQVFEKTEIIHFYWFNLLPNRFNNRTIFTEFDLCKCLHCRFFSN